MASLEKHRTYKMKVRWLKGRRVIFITDILFRDDPGLEPVIIGNLQDGFGGVVGILQKDIHDFDLLEDKDELPKVQEGNEAGDEKDPGRRPEGPQGEILPEMPRPVLHDRNLFG